jgi:hypothetical protein
VPHGEGDAVVEVEGQGEGDPVAAMEMSVSVGEGEVDVHTVTESVALSDDDTLCVIESDGDRVSDADSLPDTMPRARAAHARRSSAPRAAIALLANSYGGGRGDGVPATTIQGVCQPTNSQRIYYFAESDSRLGCVEDDGVGPAHSGERGSLDLRVPTVPRKRAPPVTRTARGSLNCRTAARSALESATRDAWIRIRPDDLVAGRGKRAKVGPRGWLPQSPRRRWRRSPLSGRRKTAPSSTTEDTPSAPASAASPIVSDTRRASIERPTSSAPG